MFNTRLDVVFGTSTVDDDGVFFAHFDTFCCTQVLQSHFFQGQADFFGDYFTASQNSDVFQHGFATITKTGSFYRNHFQDAAQGVDHQGCQCFAIHVFRDDEQRTTGFSHLFQSRQQIADVADFLVEQQHKGVIQQSGLLFLVVNEVGRQVATVKLHTFNNVQLVIKRLAVFHGDNAFFAHFIHCLGDDVTNAGIGVGRNRTHLGDFFGGCRGLGSLFQFGDQSGDGFVDTAFQIHRIHARSHVFHAFAHDGLSQNGRSGCAVARVVRGFGSNFLHHLRAHVLQLVFEFDFFSNGYTVFGHGRSAERAFQNHVTTFRAQSDFNGVCQNVHAFNHACAGFTAKNYVFCCHVDIPSILKIIQLPQTGHLLS